MYHQSQRSFGRFMFAAGLFAGLSLGQATLAAAAEPAAMPSAPPATAKPLLSGPQVYNEVCIACHAPPGLGGAPALGNREAWAPRIEQGVDMLISHALNGYSGSTGIMPKKGGRLDLSDEEISRAVEYMVERVAQ